MQNASFENLKRKNNLKDTNILQLPDGRQLCYAEYGDPDGKPVSSLSSGGGIMS